ncbi:ABC transporter substrate-binding protein [Rhodovastum atsumiense]|uniref:ABC transporter substrate-binding protein n=1 Tax=Rhodovastum atsumiense TaxID=504468 RepID=UPI001EF15E74|nr:ABC transporter substrate-binding protein [Rhodovastum atsumiense]
MLLLAACAWVPVGALAETLPRVQGPARTQALPRAQATSRENAARGSAPRPEASPASRPVPTPETAPAEVAPMELAARDTPPTDPASRAATLRVVLPQLPQQLDPALAGSGEDHVAVHLLYDGLTRFDRDMVTRPGLAESWTASDDLRSWTFRLRPEVRFHHGRRLEADDVMATMTRILDPRTGSPGRAGLEMVVRVEAIDARTVRFTLTAPYAAFADLFADRSLRVVPRDRVEGLGGAPVGTGPFMLRGGLRPDRLELVRNPAYWERGLPRLAAVELQGIADATAREAALAEGTADILWMLSAEAAERLRGDPALRVDAVPTGSWDAVVLHNGLRPFDDPRVRQALVAALDKAALIEAAFPGQAVPTHSPIPPGHPYYEDRLGHAAADPPRARQLLAEAGYPNGIDVTLHVPAERERQVRLGLAVREMARAGGFRITVERVPYAAWASHVQGRQAMFIDGASARPTVDTALYPWFHSGGFWNSLLWHYRSARMDELLDLARRTGEETRRADIFHEIQALVEQNAPGIIISVALHMNGVRRAVQGFRSSPMQWLDLKDVILSP